MFNLIPGGFGGRVTRSYVGGADNNNSSLTITATVNLGAESPERRVLILCSTGSASSPANAMSFDSLSMTGSPTIDILHSFGELSGIIGRASAIGVAHVPTGTSGISVTATFSQGGTKSSVSKEIQVYSLYGLSSNTPFSNGAFGSYDLPAGSVAIAMADQTGTPVWTGATLDAYNRTCSVASYATELGEPGRSISATPVNAGHGRVTVWAPS